MKPIWLKGHTRPITLVKYNYDGDLLFTASKDATPCLWYSDTGERIGCYKGHTGSVYSLDVNRDSTLLVTGAADTKVNTWDVQTGHNVMSISHSTPIRWVSIAEGDRLFLAVSDSVMGRLAAIYVYDYRLKKETPIREIAGTTVRYNQAHWGPLNKLIYTVSDDGSMTAFDFESGKPMLQAKDNQKSVLQMQFSQDQTHFITSSLDHTAKLYDTKSMKNLKTYEFGRPVNSASISPIRDHVIIGGGQSAESVTVTRVDAAQFKVRFFHKIYEEEFASVAGGFGPVNSLSYSPDGKSFALGGEDGYARLYHLEEEYLSLTDADLFFDEEN